MNMSGPKTRLINNIWGVCLAQQRGDSYFPLPVFFYLCVYVCVCVKETEIVPGQE